MNNSVQSSRIISIGNANCKEGKGENQFAQPRGVCLNPLTKEMFVVDCNNHRIQVIHMLSQSFIRQIGKGPGNAPGSLMYPVGICMDDRNHIFVADTNNHRIVKFNHLTGTLVNMFGSQGLAPGCFHCPYGLCVDNERQELFVADYENHRIQVLDSETGKFIRLIGSGPPGRQNGEFHQPIDVCLDVDKQKLFVADYANNRVQVFDHLTGSYLSTIDNATNQQNTFHGPRSLCINSASNLLFVADRENHRIQLFDKNTYQFIRHVGLGMGSLPGQFNRPMEICVDNDTGSLIVVDGYNHRVQIMELMELRPEKERIFQLHLQS
jgi:DNA-binding beta-propeller fold protein YncE